jgi:hypothetical protein
MSKIIYCKNCNKTFNSRQAKSYHIKKCKENENNYESSKDYTKEEVDSMGWKIKDEKKEKNNQNMNFNDIMNEQIFKEEWFDEERYNR